VCLHYAGWTVEYVLGLTPRACTFLLREAAALERERLDGHAAVMGVRTGRKGTAGTKATAAAAPEDPEHHNLLMGAQIAQLSGDHAAAKRMRLAAAVLPLIRRADKGGARA
jgi:hypothetical protein